MKFGGGGYVTGLVFHPTTANLLYARTDIGGAYRWNQATASWVPITDGLGFGAAEAGYHGVESIAVDPNNDQLVYMAAGMYTSEGNGRLYISSDRGDHWTYVGLPFPLGGNNPGRAIGERLMVDPNKPSTLFYGSRTAGLWKSVDSGLTWAQVTSLSTAKLTQDQVNALGMDSAMGVETVVYDTGTKGSGSATQTIYAAIAPDYVQHGGPGLEPVQVHQRRRFVDRRSRPRSPAITSRTWCAPQTACSMSRSPRTPARAPAAPPGSTSSTAATGPCSDRTRRTTRLGFGGVSVSGTGATTRIALGVTNTWGNFSGQQIIQLSDDGGHDLARDRGHHAAYAGRRRASGAGPTTSRSIRSTATTSCTSTGGGIWETRNASSSTPSWNEPIDGIEETAVLGLATPPAGATYTVINSSGDVGTWVHTNLATKPTLTPATSWSNGFAADMAWSDPQYMATIGVVLGTSTGYGVWSGDGGKTWAKFATYAPGVADQHEPGSEHRGHRAQQGGLGARQLGAVLHHGQRRHLGADQSAGDQQHLPSRLPPGRRSQEPEQGLCLRFGRPLVGHAGQGLRLDGWRPHVHAEPGLGGRGAGPQLLLEHLARGQPQRRGRPLAGRRQRRVPLGGFRSDLDEAEPVCVDPGQQPVARRAGRHRGGIGQGQRLAPRTRPRSTWWAW